MPELVVKVELRGANLKLLQYTGPEVVVSACAGSGKTVAGCWAVHLHALQNPGSVGLIVRATHVSLAATTLQTYQRQVAAEAIRHGLCSWYGGSGKDPASFRYENGSVVYVAGGDRPDKFLSLEVDLILVDEASEITLNLYEVLLSRLRGPSNGPKRIIMLTNPSFPDHWIKRRSDVGTLKMFTGSFRDNPAYVNSDGTYTPAGQEYRDKLGLLTGVRRSRLLDGLWVAAEGLVYESFSPEIHVVDPFAIPPEWPRFITVDFGFTNPFVAQWWAEDPDGRLILYREIYRAKRLVEDHAAQMKKIMADEPVPKMIICDHDAEDRATLERHLGMSTSAANKKVLEGLQATQERLRVQGDGKPRLFLVRDAVVEIDVDLREAGKPTSTIAEFSGYIWDTRGTGALKEAPLKVDDHGMDALRYMVMDRQQHYVGSFYLPA